LARCVVQGAVCGNGGDLGAHHGCSSEHAKKFSPCVFLMPATDCSPFAGFPSRCWLVCVLVPPVCVGNHVPLLQVGSKCSSHKLSNYPTLTHAVHFATSPSLSISLLPRLSPPSVGLSDRGQHSLPSSLADPTHQSPLQRLATCAQHCTRPDRSRTATCAPLPSHLAPHDRMPIPATGHFTHLTLLHHARAHLRNHSTASSDRTAQKRAGIIGGFREHTPLQRAAALGGKQNAWKASTCSRKRACGVRKQKASTCNGSEKQLQRRLGRSLQGRLALGADVVA
jgi:hypothetical protein